MLIGRHFWPPFRRHTTLRFTVENLDMPATGQLKALDVDNGLALEDWRASGLGPCAAMFFERQVLGEYPHSEEVRKSKEKIHTSLDYYFEAYTK